jgi:hypothetical protein
MVKVLEEKEKGTQSVPQAIGTLCPFLRALPRRRACRQAQRSS